MKKHTLILGIVFLLLLGFAAFFWFGGTLSARLHIKTVSAADQPGELETVRRVLADGSAPRRFSDLPEDLSGCTLAEVTLELENRGFLPAEWLNVQPEYVDGDIAVYALTGEGATLPARTVSQVSLRLITAARPDAPRAFRIQYYVYGMKRTIVVE